MPQLTVVLALCAIALPLSAAHAQAPAQWTAEYPTGDSCLFCHRNEIGSTWLDNAHAWTIRPVGEPPAVGKLADDATHVIGKAHARALKQQGYGRFALRTADGSAWQDGVFAQKCAGCHTTAVNPANGEFASAAVDCYACHGNVPENHPSQEGVALLALTRADTAGEVLSICGSCHLRGGRSQATGRPYPNAYVAGNDLFGDFKVDLSESSSTSLDANDRHVYKETRAVLAGKSQKTCIDCHRIHGPPHRKQGKLPGDDGRRFSEVCGYRALEVTSD